MSDTIQALRQALPYVRLYKGKTFVVKIGGAPCSDAARLKDLAQSEDLARYVL